MKQYLVVKEYTYKKNETHVKEDKYLIDKIGSTYLYITKSIHRREKTNLRLHSLASDVTKDTYKIKKEDLEKFLYFIDKKEETGTVYQIYIEMEDGTLVNYIEESDYVKILKQQVGKELLALNNIYLELEEVILENDRLKNKKEGTI